MKRLLFTLLALLILNFNGWAISPSSTFPILHKIELVEHPVQSTNIQFRIDQMKLFISLTPEKYGELRGKKLNFPEKLSFKVSHRRMKKMLKHYEYGDEPTTLQKISWLCQGLLLGPIALIVGYLFLKDEERELIKWIWFGFAGFAIIFLALLLSL
jgi:hypothetical protein